MRGRSLALSLILASLAMARAGAAACSAALVRTLFAAARRATAASAAMGPT